MAGLHIPDLPDDVYLQLAALRTGNRRLPIGVSLPEVLVCEDRDRR
jgi:hypothetical protein